MDGFRTGRDAINMSSALDFQRAFRFVMGNTALKISAIIAIAFIVLGGWLATRFPAIESIATASGIIIIAGTLAFLYQQYLVSLAVGMRNYSFKKYLEVALFAGLGTAAVVLFVPAFEATFLGSALSAAFLFLGFMIFFKNKATWTDVLKIVLIGFALSWILTLISAGAILIGIANLDLDLFSTIIL